MLHYHYVNLESSDPLLLCILPKYRPKCWSEFYAKSLFVYCYAYHRLLTDGIKAVDVYPESNFRRAIWHNKQYSSAISATYSNRPFTIDLISMLKLVLGALFWISKTAEASRSGFLKPVQGDPKK